MDESRWPRVMVPLSLIFFRVPVSSSAITGVERKAAAMATLSTRWKVRMNRILDVVVVMALRHFAHGRSIAFLQ